MRLSALALSLSLLALPASADIEQHCWLQPDDTDTFVMITNGVRGTVAAVPVSTTVPAGAGLCPAGGLDCNQHCVDIDLTRPYTWDIVAQGPTGLETNSVNGPQQRFIVVLPPAGPILMGPPSP